ncbi:12059_t:CDS:2, partial [Cetraspora pellucida]
HESEIFISDLEILNDGASFQETFKEKEIFKEVLFQETFICREHATRYDIISGNFYRNDTQDLYMDINKSKIVIPDLENLDDDKYSSK